VDAAEAAVAHDQHMVAGFGSGGNRRDELQDIAMDFGLGAERRERGGRVPPQLRAEAEYAIGAGEAGCEFIFHHSKLHRVRARLDYGNYSRASDLVAQHGKRAETGGSGLVT
jgi:hypothetical protein